MKHILFSLLLFLNYSSIDCSILNFDLLGGVKDNYNYEVFQHNTNLINTLFKNSTKNDTLIIPNYTYWFNGGIYAHDIQDLTIILDGIIKFQNNRSLWPTKGYYCSADKNDEVQESILFENIANMTITSTKKGLIDGQGEEWWGVVNYLKYRENRPRLLHIKNTTNILVESIILKDSPYWTFYADDVSNMEIRNINIDARRTDRNYHSLYDLTAFNTDGIDVSGKNIYIHDVNIWNQDDCIAVKSQDSSNYQSHCSENMLFENINSSGIGLTIGSVGTSKYNSCVNNITFRNSYMYNTFKGIYIKSRPGKINESAMVTNIVYDNITILNPSQWGIWIGPQQAIYDKACSLLWPYIPGTECYVPSVIHFENITLKNIFIKDPIEERPGVILGNETNPIKNLTFNNVIVERKNKKNYICKNVDLNSINKSIPLPVC